MKQTPPSPGSSVLDAIGNTPVVPLRKLAPSGGAEVWVKLEYLSPTGSYKDRMALAMIESAEHRGDLRPGMRVVEYTGGSTGSSLAFVCAIKGYRVHLVSSDAFAREKLDTMRAFGGTVEIIPSRGGVTTPDLIPRMIARAREVVAEGNSFATDQFNNRDSLDGYERIGEELLDQLGPTLTAFCGSVGTAGMLMGVARALRRRNTKIRIVAFEPDGSPVLSTGRPGSHTVDGIGSGFVPPLFDRECCSDVRAISEKDARELARRLAAEEGIFAGTSTALNVLGAIAVARELRPGERVVTVAVDTGLKYLAGDLYRPE